MQTIIEHIEYIFEIITLQLILQCEVFSIYNIDTHELQEIVGDAVGEGTEFRTVLLVERLTCVILCDKLIPSIGDISNLRVLFQHGGQLLALLIVPRGKEHSRLRVPGRRNIGHQHILFVVSDVVIYHIEVLQTDEGGAYNKDDGYNEL